jgi:cell shape-determining protein MreC
VVVSNEILTENRVLKAKLEEMNSRLNSLDTIGSQN